MCLTLELLFVITFSSWFAIKKNSISPFCCRSASQYRMQKRASLSKSYMSWLSSLKNYIRRQEERTWVSWSSSLSMSKIRSTAAYGTNLQAIWSLSYGIDSRSSSSISSSRGFPTFFSPVLKCRSIRLNSYRTRGK